MTLPFLSAAGTQSDGIRPISLRARLRLETAQAHDRLDRILTDADVSTRAGLAQFLYTQAFGFDRIDGLLDPEDMPRTAPVIDVLRDRLRADLGVMGIAHPAATAGQSSTENKGADCGNLLTASAVDYMVLGSGLGAAVLRKRWMRSADPTLRGVGGFLGAERSLEDWKTLVVQLDALPGAGSHADRSVADATRIFDFFSDGWEDFHRTKAPTSVQTGRGNK